MCSSKGGGRLCHGTMAQRPVQAWPVTRVDLEIFGLIKMVSNIVRPYGLPIRLLPPHTIQRYGGQPVADTFPPSG